MKTAIVILGLTLGACMTEIPTPDEVPQTSDTAQESIGGPFCKMTGCTSDWYCQIACDNNEAQCLIYEGADGIEHGRCLDWQPL